MHVIFVSYLFVFTACDRIPKLSKRKDVQIVNDLSPTMTVDTRGDQSVVNISWTVTVISTYAISVLSRVLISI